LPRTLIACFAAKNFAVIHPIRVHLAELFFKPCYSRARMKKLLTALLLLTGLTALGQTNEINLDDFMQSAPQ
jgi:hypothetical protein